MTEVEDRPLALFSDTDLLEELVARNPQYGILLWFPEGGLGTEESGIRTRTLRPQVTPRPSSRSNALPKKA